MKKLLNYIQSLTASNEMEATRKPKVHYLINRLNRLKNLSQLARSDNNFLKVKQADRLIKDMEAVLNTNGRLLYAHIEQKPLNN